MSISTSSAIQLILFFLGLFVFQTFLTGGAHDRREVFADRSSKMVRGIENHIVNVIDKHAHMQEIGDSYLSSRHPIFPDAVSDLAEHIAQAALLRKRILRMMSWIRGLDTFGVYAGVLAWLVGVPPWEQMDQGWLQAIRVGVLVFVAGSLLVWYHLCRQLTAVLDNADSFTEGVGI